MWWIPREKCSCLSCLFGQSHWKMFWFCKIIGTALLKKAALRDYLEMSWFSHSLVLIILTYAVGLNLNARSIYLATANFEFLYRIFSLFFFFVFIVYQSVFHWPTAFHGSSRQILLTLIWVLLGVCQALSTHVKLQILGLNIIV